MRAEVQAVGLRVELVARVGQELGQLETSEVLSEQVAQGEQEELLQRVAAFRPFEFSMSIGTSAAAPIAEWCYDVLLILGGDPET